MSVTTIRSRVPSKPDAFLPARSMPGLPLYELFAEKTCKSWIGRFRLRSYTAIASPAALYERVEADAVRNTRF